MKNFILASALVLLGANAQADTIRYVNGDDSDYSELCLAALDSEQAFNTMASRLGSPALIRRELRCNNRSLPVFIRTMQMKTAKLEARYQFSVGDENAYSRLCIAAVNASYDDEYTSTSLREQFGINEREVLCNGIPLKNFVRKYRNKEALSLSIR